MARTASNMLPLGSPLPAFRLPAVDGRTYGHQDFSAPLLVMFVCNHCPFVKHVREELARLGRDYSGKVSVIAISSNDAAAYPQDSFELMKAEAKEAGYNFPYLYDESQAAAHAFGAACTPDFFLYDRAHQLAYRGQLDDSRPGNRVPVTGKDLRAALDAVVAGNRPSSDQRPSLGCNVKWKPGNEPGGLSR